MYCISGMPRCRTAWLTAVLYAHGAEPQHDIFALNYVVDDLDEIVDPAVALLTPHEALAKFDMTISLHADSMKDRLDALERSAHKEITLNNSTREVYGDNFLQYHQGAQVRLHVSELEDNQVVAEVIRTCTNKEPSLEIISTFQLLKVEEHMEKAQSTLKPLPSRSPEFQQSLLAIINGTSTIPDEVRMALHTPL